MPRPAARARPIVALGLGVALAVLVAAGCGESPEKQIRATLDRFAAATRAKDYQRLCDDLFSSKLVAQVRSVGLPCEVALRMGLGEVRRPSLVVRRVQVSGDKALARVRTAAVGQQPSEDTVELVREKGDWRIASLARPQPQPPTGTQP